MKEITIVGGGLAGLTLGILLRRESIPVAIIEAGHYPRHRVCGEFLSGSGRMILRELGLEARLLKTREASTCTFHLRRNKALRFQLRAPALCVSRYDLDAALAEEFQRAGGILKTRERASTNNPCEGLVRATGRRRADASAGRLFGLKAHTTNASLSSDLEMHFGPRRYVGLCRVGAGRVNVCGLFHTLAPNPHLHESWKRIFAASVFSNALCEASWDDDSFCSVAGLTMDRESPDDQFAIGDAAAMIPPLTGNGMSMAIESALLASEHLIAYCSGRVSWTDCLKEHSLRWRAEFSSRLRWAAFAQSLIFQPASQSAFFLGARFFPMLPNLFFSLTR